MINDELLHKWVNQTISEDELKIFKARPEYESLVKLYQQTESLSTPNIDTDTMLQNILQQDKPTFDLSQSKKSNINLWTKLAAAATILLICSIFLFPRKTTIENYQWATIEETLPDGSSFILYTDSKIKYQKSSWSKSRSIELDGKAFFKVTKGTKFEVNSQKGKVEVLGTEFLIDNNNGYHVYCSEGKVKVSSKLSNENAIISADESFSILQNASILRKNETTKTKNLDLESIIKEIEDVFNVTFEIKDIDLSQRLTSGFQHDNLENAIKTISLPLNLNYKINGNRITLNNK